jgi:hypothetical protein
MSIVLLGSTSGSITLSEPAVAGTTTLDLPATSGTVVVGSAAVSAAGQIPFSTNGTTYTPTAKIVQGTAVASTSGTSVDFTSIPSWVKRITVMFVGVSTSGTSPIQIQLGTGATPTYTTSGYLGAAYQSSSATFMSAGLLVNTNVAAALACNGNSMICSQTGNTWVMSSFSAYSATNNPTSSAGSIALAAALTAVRITTVNGTDTFDAGSINILYE